MNDEATQVHGQTADGELHMTVYSSSKSDNQTSAMLYGSASEWVEDKLRRTSKDGERAAAGTWT